MEDEYYEEEVPVVGYAVTALVSALAALGISKIVRTVKTRRNMKKEELKKFLDSHEKLIEKVEKEVAEAEADLSMTPEQIAEKAATEAEFLEIVWAMKPKQ